MIVRFVKVVLTGVLDYALVNTFFFFKDTATTEIYTFPTRRSSDLDHERRRPSLWARHHSVPGWNRLGQLDRKSTRLNSSHVEISYAVFCLKKKKKSSISSQLDHSSRAISFTTVHLPLPYKTTNTLF